MQPVFRPAFVTIGSVCLAFTVGAAGCADPVAAPAPLAQRLFVTYWQQPVDARGSTVSPFPGLNVDGRISDGATSWCDEVRDAERGERVGIDNGYALLAALLQSFGVPVSELVPAQLAVGEGLYGFDVEPSLEPGGPVYVTLLSFEASEPLALDADQRVRATSDLVVTPGATVEATYYEGHWRALFRELDVPMGRTLGLRPVHDVVVEFEMLEGRFTAAQLGARVSIETAIAVGVDATGEPEAGVRDVLRTVGAADLEPNADGSECGAISFGVRLELAALAR